MANAGTEAAIGAGLYILAPDQLGVAHQPFGDEVGVLDKVGAVADDARNKCCAVGQLYVLEHPPFVLMARIGRLDGVTSSINPENQMDDVPQRNVVMVRTVEAAPADMQSHLLARDPAERVI